MEHRMLRFDPESYRQEMQLARELTLRSLQRSIQEYGGPVRAQSLAEVREAFGRVLGTRSLLEYMKRETGYW